MEDLTVLLLPKQALTSFRLFRGEYPIPFLDTVLPHLTPAYALPKTEKAESMAVFGLPSHCIVDVNLNLYIDNEK